MKIILVVADARGRNTDTDRGLQIADQFYRLAQEWLHSP